MSDTDQTQPERTDEFAYPLDRDDQRVQAAREAEQQAYEHYGLEFTEHFIDVPSLETRIRVVEVGTGMMDICSPSCTPLPANSETDTAVSLSSVRALID